MNGASTTEETTARALRRQRRPAPEPFVLPQWVIELIVRPVLIAFFRIVWGLRLSGIENIPPAQSGGLVIAANHQTYVDPFWVSAPIKRPLRYLAWSEAFNWPLVGPLITLLGAWPLQIEGRDPAAIRRAIQYLRGGGAVVIFPEGGRCEEDGATKGFKCGAARIALEAGVPVLPVTIRGAHRIWPRGWRLPRLGRVEIIYHPLQQLTQRAGEDARHSARRETERLQEIVTSALKADVRC